MSDLSLLLRSEHSSKDLQSVLQSPAAALLGVSNAAAAALASVGLNTVFDLGSSRLFFHADLVLQHSDLVLGPMPADLLKPEVRLESLSQAADEPLSSLRGVSNEQAVDLNSSLDVLSIREFSLWPARMVSRRLVQESVGVDASGVEDGEAEKLRPKFGEYPTERVYYDALVMFGSTDTDGQVELEGPLSLQSGSEAGAGFSQPAIGALATWSQSWFAQGITLGHMLHSLALAPGEATRIAVMDWSRRSRAATSESIDESEALSNATDHSRAISEVQNAVADEMQSGGSMSSGWAKSKSKSKGLSGSVGGGVAGIAQGVTGVFGFGGGGSKTSQEAESSFGAESTSWSIGTRSVMAEMTQNVNDRTEQHASSVRNRRATAVREVSQSEHESISTRVVANYNHMHALTVQYYEVVQVYRAFSQLHRVRRVLFLPFDFLDFSGADAQEVVARYRDNLIEAALSRRILELLLDEQGLITIRPGVLVSVPTSVGVMDSGNVAARDLTFAFSRMVAGGGSVPTGNTVAQPVPPPTPPPPRSRIVTRPGAALATLAGDTLLTAISFSDINIERVRLVQPGTPAEASTFLVPVGSGQLDLTAEVPLRSLERIDISKGNGDDLTGTMTLHVQMKGQQGHQDVAVTLKDSNSLQRAAFIEADPSNREDELLAHLQANRSHYTRQVLLGLDSAALVMLLSGTSWKGRPLADQVEPVPVSVAGNFLVLRAPVDDESDSGLDDTGTTWAELLAARGLDFAAKDQRLIPIPTGGVFAEAVLGRSNSAEKLDITRFWNWQDSPIPLAPTEIAPISAGSRAQGENLTPGQLGTPVLNITNPSTLPDPAGVGAAFTALAQSQLFRDMSGLVGTQAAAQAASANTLNAATAAGQIASQNYKVASDQATAMGQAAVDLWKVHKSSKSNGGGSSNSNVSTDGAKVNLGRDLDERGVSGAEITRGGQKKPVKIQHLRSEFQGSGGGGVPSSPPGVVGSRELAYADDAVASSGALIGAVADALGVGGPVRAFGAGLDTAVLDALMISVIERDAASLGINLGSAKLLSMDSHANSSEFKPIYGAWTNSADEVFINLDGMRQAMATDDVDALKEARATAIFIVQHEEAHVQQFIAGGGHPATFQQMAGHEFKAYGDDLVFLAKSSVKNHFVNVLKMDLVDAGVFDDGLGQQKGTGLLGSIRAIVESNLAFLQQHKDDPDDPALKQLMITRDFLPAMLQNNASYTMADLYTK